jgi:hypothetical protein
MSIMTFITREHPRFLLCFGALSATCAIAVPAFPQTAPDVPPPSPSETKAPEPARAPMISTPDEDDAADALPPATPAPPSPPAPPPKIVFAEKPCAPCEREDEEAAEGAGAFFIGAGFFDLSSLNERLRDHGYERISPWATLIGGEGHAVLESGFVAGARGAAIVYQTGDGPNGMRTHLGGGFGMLDFGFALVRRSPILLTLTASIGGYGTSLAIGDEQSARFDDVLADPRRSTSLDRGGLLTGLTLGFDGRVPVGRVERGRRGFFTLGARLGVLYGPALGDWGFSPDAEATAGPHFGLTGAFAGVAIGFGGGSVALGR